jgi:hypothetical protein
MNTNPLNRRCIEKLSCVDQAQLDTNESDVVLREVRKWDPNIENVPIPIAMYQSFILLVFLEEMPTYDEYKNIRGTLRDRDPLINAELKKLRRRYLEWEDCIFSSNWSKFYNRKQNDEQSNIVCQASKAYIESPQIQDLFWRVNNRIIKFLSDRRVDLKNFTLDQFTMVASQLVDKLAEMIGKIEPSTSHWVYWESGSIQLRELKNSSQKNSDKELLIMADQIRNFMVLSMILEYIIMIDPSMAGKYRIYRGGHSSTKYNDQISTSFGAGVFSSIISSPNGDMPSDIALRKGSLWYVDIDKSTYRNNSQYGVHIPPILPLGSACGDGEVHHPRGKILKSTIKDRNTSLKGVSFNIRESELLRESKLEWLITSNAEALKEICNGTKILLTNLNQSNLEQPPYRILTDYSKKILEKFSPEKQDFYHRFVSKFRN